MYYIVCVNKYESQKIRKEIKSNFTSYFSNEFLK